MLSEATRNRITQLKERYPHYRSALLPALYLAQEEQGFLSEEAMVEVGGLLGLTPADVRSVASYYTMYFKKPIGRHVIDICTNLACKARGSDAVVEYVKRKLDVELGATTRDGRFFVEEVECLGQCELAPMLEIDLEPIGPLDVKLSAEALDRALDQYT
jgi:NADH-quinone oxidoreductase subunit E